jgi:hypothetical protein
MNWKYVSVSNVYMPPPAKEDLRFNGCFKKKMRNRRVGGWRLKDGSTYFICKQLDVPGRRIIEHRFLISADTFEAMDGIFGWLNNKAYVEELHAEQPAKLCAACGENKAECMGDLCFKCDHLEGDRGNND